EEEGALHAGEAQAPQEGQILLAGRRGGAQEAPPKEAPGLQEEEEAAPEAVERHASQGHHARDAARARSRSTCPPAAPATEALGHQLADRGLRRSVRLRPGRAASVAGGIRPTPRPGGRA